MQTRVVSVWNASSYGACTHNQVAMNSAVCAYLAERDVTTPFSAAARGTRLSPTGIPGLDDIVVFDLRLRRRPGDTGRCWM